MSDLIIRLSLNLFHPLLTSTPLWPHCDAPPIHLDSPSSRPQFPPDQAPVPPGSWISTISNSPANVLPPFALSLHIILVQKFPTCPLTLSHAWTSGQCCKHTHTHTSHLGRLNSLWINGYKSQIRLPSLTSENLPTSPTLSRQTCLRSYRETGCVAAPIHDWTLLLGSGETTV